MNDDLLTSTSEVAADEPTRLRELLDAQTRVVDQLSRSLEDLKSTYDHAPDPCILVDMTTGFVSQSNLTLSRLLEIPLDQIVGRPLCDLLSCDSSADAVRLLDQLRCADGVKDLDIKLLKSDGSELQVSLNSSLIRDRDGAAVQCVLAIRDYTHLREARESQSRLAFIVESSADAIISKTLDGTVTSWNRGAEMLFGFAAEEIVGQSIEMIVPVDKINELREVHEDMRLNGLAKQLESVRLRKDGTRIDVMHTVSPVRDTAGCLLGVSAIIRDISKRKAFEEGIQKAKLAAEEARQAAENANRAKSAFLANMSHEIRTPLNGILGFTELMRRSQLDASTRREYLDIIYSSGTHLLTLINEILDLSKVEAGGLELELQPCSPQGILDDVLSVLSVQAASKSIELKSCWTSRQPESIVSDPERLRQIIMNLVGNALKFTESGAVAIEAALIEDLNEPQVALTVIDTGIGIRAEHLGKIFSPFDQADSSMTRRFGGTGLGLTICQRIAREMGGDITVESEFGKGSRFTLTFDVGPMDNMTFVPNATSPSTKTTAEEQPQPSSDAKVSHRLEGISVLLCEDGETNRRLFELVLTDAGATVQAVENGLLGVEAVQRGDDIDVILMDMQMPVLDGYSATERIRSMGWTKPIIALTAHAMRGDRDKCCNAGCSGYLTKPLNFDELLQTVAASASKNPSDAIRVPASMPELVTASTSTSTTTKASITTQASALGQITCSRSTERVEIRAIVEKFVDDLDARLDAIRVAIDDLDFETVSQFAHKLKGSGGTIGFDCFTVPAGRLESSAKAGELESSRQLLVEIESLCGRIDLPWRREVK